jgi:hypothetical protein
MESDMMFLLSAKKAAQKSAHRERSISLPLRKHETSSPSLFGSAPFVLPPRFGSYFSQAATTKAHDDDHTFPSPTVV